MYSDWLDQRFEEIWSRKYSFFGAFMIVLFSTYSVLFAIDFIPERPEGGAQAAATEETSEEELKLEEEQPQSEPDVPASIDPYPERIIIEALDREVSVLNPESRSIEALDEALLSGTVRHPDSADFQNQGTMFILGHSSYLPTVHNRNFQAFNGIQKLSWGDIIRVQSSDTEYVYRVRRVYEAKASSASVPLRWDKPELVIATCNTFGAKEDRYVVEAMFVESRQIRSQGLFE